MIDFLVTIIVALFYLYLVYSFASVGFFLLNAVLIAVFYFLIKGDLKDHHLHGPYLAGLLIAAFFLILSSAKNVGNFIAFLEFLKISLVSIIMVVIYFSAHLVALARHWLRIGHKHRHHH